MKHQLSNMLSVCAEAFKLSLDDHGEPYFMHCMRVMQKVPDDEILQCIAIGHDLFEDTNINEDDLLFISPRIKKGIRDLTKIKGEDYSTYLDRVCSNRDAIIVKLADIEDNLDVRRIKGNTPKDNERTIKYINAYITLKSKL